MRGLILAAPRSGAGKTTITVALAAALSRRGLDVRAAKSGPDYIDPGFLEAATGAPCLNLDSWAMRPALLDRQLARAGGGDILLIESAMGLLDGVEAPPGRTGAAADLAARWDIPVVLVLDVSGQSQSAAAVARGFAMHDPRVRVAGVVLNRVGSERHRAMVARAVADSGIALFGSVPRDPAIALPERHLGLVQADQVPVLRPCIAALADLAEHDIEIDRIMEAAVPLPPPLAGEGPCLPPPGQRIALATDAAFSFVYLHLLQDWCDAGAEIIRFSPLADEPPPEHCDACWLPGGYPELYAGCLAAAANFRAGLARFAQTRPVHGECGGYMVLGRGLDDADGQRHAMCGLLGHSTSFARRRLHLGYREARLLGDSPLGPGCAVIRGHEFHYATLLEAGDDAPFAELADAAGRNLGAVGGRRGRVSGTFFHAIARA